jgi:hypothetical protein
MAEMELHSWVALGISGVLSDEQARQWSLDFSQMPVKFQNPPEGPARVIVGIMCWKCELWWSPEVAEQECKPVYNLPAVDEPVSKVLAVGLLMTKPIYLGSVLAVQVGVLLGNYLNYSDPWGLDRLLALDLHWQAIQMLVP